MKALCWKRSQSTAYERLEIIPSEVDLCGVDFELARAEHHLQRVQIALAPLLEAERFDVIFIDCPPSLGVLTLNAFTGSDGVLVPYSASISRSKGSRC